MAHSPTQHALRELRKIFATPIAQIILLAVVILLGISGPFGTLENLPFGPRLAYWAVTVPSTFAVGVVVSAFVAQILRGKTSILVTRFAISLTSAIAIGATVVVLNYLAFAAPPASVESVLPIIAVAGVITFVYHYMTSAGLQITGHSSKETSVPLMDRIELSKRGSLISISVQDHYVEVTTSAGTSLLLMRLSDAMREVGTVQGLQIHRSHWVAIPHVRGARREGDKAVLTLSDGRELPASRSNIKALKEVGILPR